MYNQKQQGTVVTLRSLFQQFDQDQDGYLSVYELKNFFAASGQHLTDHELQIQMKYVGVTNPKGVSYNEFGKFVKQDR